MSDKPACGCEIEHVGELEDSACLYPSLLAEHEALKEKFHNVMHEVQRYQPAGSPPPGDAAMLTRWILHRQELQHDLEHEALKKAAGALLSTALVQEHITVHDFHGSKARPACRCKLCEALRELRAALGAPAPESKGE